MLPVPLAFAHADQWELFHKVTFDGPNRIIQVNAGVRDLDVLIDVYSAWKDWVRTRDNLKWVAAMRSTGGDPTPSGTLGGVIFLRNGWKIRPASEDHTLLVAGDLFTEEGDSPYVPALGDASVFLLNEFSNLTSRVDPGGRLR